MPKRTITNKMPNVKSTQVACMEYCVSAWSHMHYVKDKSLLECIQQRFTKLYHIPIPGIQHLHYEDQLKLKEVNLWILEER